MIVTFCFCLKFLNKNLAWVVRLFEVGVHHNLILSGL